MKLKIKKYLISENKKILDLYKYFEKNGVNICIVVNKDNKFLGIVTPSDIRKGITKGYSLNSKIKEITNKNPIIVKGIINDNKISDIVSNKNYNYINPPLIPFISEKNIPYDIVDKENIHSLKKQVNLLNKKITQRILLIGGAGYIGSILTKKLVAQGNNVDVFDKFIYLKKKNFEKIINHKKLNCIKGDSRHVDKIFESIQKCDAVVHLAEMVGDPLCEQRPTKTYVTNYLASTHLVALGEAWTIAKKSNLNLSKVYKGIAVSSGNSFVHETESQVILNGSYNINFTMDLVLKDTGLFNNLAKKLNAPLEISPLIVKIFEDGQKKYGSRAWSSMIVKRMEELNNIDFRADGFPGELIDNEQEEKGYEI